MRGLGTLRPYGRAQFMLYHSTGWEGAASLLPPGAATWQHRHSRGCSTLIGVVVW